MKGIIRICTFAVVLTAVSCDFWEHPIDTTVEAVSGLFSSTKEVASQVGDFFVKQFEDFKKTFNKVYKSAEEEKKRLEIFIENQKIIEQLEKTASTFQLKLNEFGDLLGDEFNKLYNGLRPNSQKSVDAKPFVPNKKVKLPENVDWRKMGAVTPARHQKRCASCYAFAAVAALESHLFIKNRKNLEWLSPQNVMDCSRAFRNHGCVSGAVDNTFDYIKKNGIKFDAAYPYKAKVQQCKQGQRNAVNSIKDYVVIDQGDERALEEAVALKGPVAVGIDGSLKSLRFYKGGIYQNRSCSSSPSKTNHAVLVVGYGKEADGTKYWLIKNSYGSKWGENGFGKIGRNVKNPCGIANYAAYPVL